MADVFSGDRKAAAARAIDNAVAEITIGLSRNAEAARIFNEAREDDPNLAQRGVETAASPESRAKKACEGAGLHWDDSAPEGEKCRREPAQGQPAEAEPAEPPPPTIPAELVTGWAHFADEWRTARARMGSFFGEDVDQLLVQFTRRTIDWQAKFRPFFPITVELKPYDPTQAPASKLTIGLAVGGALLGGFFLWRALAEGGQIIRAARGARAAHRAEEEEPDAGP